MNRPLRLSLDVNVWMSYLLGLRKGRTSTVPTRVIDMVLSGRIGPVPLQLVVAKETLGTLERVATANGIPLPVVADLVTQIINIAKYGPEELDPFVFFGRETLQMKDQEDAGVLASAIIASADFLLTDNLVDFRNKDAWEIETSTVSVSGNERKLFAVVHERADDVAVVIAHPIDFVRWVDTGLTLSVDGLIKHYGIDRAALVQRR